METAKDMYWKEQLKILQLVIADDKEEIKAMRCCGNCEFGTKDWSYSPDGYLWRCRNILNSQWDDYSEGCKFWEIKESE